jgi:hypothetical protein
MAKQEGDKITPDFLLKMILLYAIILLGFANKNNLMGSLGDTHHKTVTAAHFTGILKK